MLKFFQLLLFVHCLWVSRATNTNFLDIKNGETELNEEIDIELRVQNLTPEGMENYPKNGKEFSLTGFFKSTKSSQIVSLTIGNEFDFDFSVEETSSDQALLLFSDRSFFEVTPK